MEREIFRSASATLLSAMSAPAPVESTQSAEQVGAEAAADLPWICVVWDDPVNLMSYVTYVFQRVFGYSKEKAHELMLKVHNDGRAVVSSGSRDRMESDVRRLQEAGLWATIQKEL